jgi:hypothetical protein
MKNNLIYFWDNYKKAVYAIVAYITGVIIGISLLVFFYLVGWSNQYKIDCNLATGPSLHTTFWTNNDPYAYNPEGFCAKLKERIANK